MDPAAPDGRSEMSRAIKAIACASLLFSAACTTAHTITLSKNEIILVVQSHSSSSNQDDLADRTMSEAAEFTLAHGFRYFSILAVSDRSKEFVAAIPELHPSTETAATGGAQIVNQSLAYPPASKVSIRWLGDQVRVRMFSDGAPEGNQSGVFDAKTISRR
jgi:hypothetical protein